jgi:Tol biopolymer transport system component
MLRKCLFILSCVIFSSTTALAQFYPTQYRPPNQQWQQLKTPHFNLIYARGNDSTAFRLGRILEAQYGKTKQLVGGDLNNFPVILNDYNDRSNGFVSPLHFRSEIELPPIKGKVLNPQTGNWLQNVGPHELVHAMQFSNFGDSPILDILSLFSPDATRSVHSTIPIGMLEGIAVHHETANISEHGGRGQYPFFANKFNATFKSSQRWSMGQLFHSSTDTRPFDRHYIGGYEFTAWLHAQYGPDITRKSLDFFLDYPFLGYGVALRHTTGEWPHQLYDSFEAAHQDSLRNIKDHDSGQRALDIPYDGSSIRRPQWLNNSTLIFYGSFYDGRPGFYKYNLTTNELNRIATTNSVRDYRYDLSADRSRMIYSYYETNPIYDNTAKAELVEHEFSTGQSRQLTKDGRLYAPQYFGDKLLALQTKPASSQLVRMDKSASKASLDTLASLDHHQIIAVAPHPSDDKWAVVSNQRGTQALWMVDPQTPQQSLQRPPTLIFEEGAIFDPSWHPGGEKLLFSSDFSGTHQLYEYIPATESVQQVTSSSFNALEGAYSPDGNQIAFIKQVKNEQLPFVMPKSASHGKEIAAPVWRPTQRKSVLMQLPAISDSMVTASSSWNRSAYSPGANWLKPRTIIPVFEEFSNRDTYQYGLGFHSNNLMASQSYSARFSYFEEQIWYDFTYRNKSFFPGFKTRLYSQPSYRSIGANQTLLRQERSLALSFPTRIRLRQNVFSSSLFFEPEIRRSQLRFSEVGGTGNTSDFANFTAANLYTQFNYRLQQNLRDLQPNSGLIFFAELEHFFSADQLGFNAFGNQINFNITTPTALRGGIYSYLSPLRRWNQSLRIGLRGLTQSGLLFDNQSLVSNGFSGPVLGGSRNIVAFDSRYTIPITYYDNGGLMLPFYLSNIHAVLFSNTVTDPTLTDWQQQSRTVFGLGLRAQFRLSNLSFTIGVGFGYEPTRGNTQFFIGDF